MKEEEGCENCIYYGGRNVDRWGNEDYICVHPYSDELDSSETGVCSGYVRVTEETPYLVKDDGWVYADPDEEEE